MITSCISARNFRRPLRFGRCLFLQFSNSDLKDAVVVPKIKQLIRSVLNSTIAEEHTLRFKIINRFLNRQFNSRPRYGYGQRYGAGGTGGGGGGYGNDYGGNTFNDPYGNTPTRANRFDNYDNTYP